MTADVAIFVVAVGISEKIKDRFAECIKLSAPSCSFDVLFYDEPRPPGYVFSKSRIMNRAIKELCKQPYKVVVQADVDIIVPPGLIDKTLELGIEPMRCFHNHHRRVQPAILPPLPASYHKMDWDHWFQKVVPENANGCWNGMTPETWMKSGGFNERMICWGTEDDAFRHTAGPRGVRFLNYNKFCLIHVNHPPRMKDMRRHNKHQMAVLAEMGGKDWLND